MTDFKNIAVLIDADNTELKRLEAVLNRIATYGHISVKRAYGNWTKDVLKDWPAEIKRLAIYPVQQFDYVSKKNASDIALVIDAMELLYKEKYDCFVLISSDSDFTPLSIKIKESSLFVIGVGKAQTPESFRKACDDFILLENIEPLPSPTAETEAFQQMTDTSPSEQVPETALTKETSTIPLPPKSYSFDNDHDQKFHMEIIHTHLKNAWETYQDEDGYVNVSAAGSYLKRIIPDFDAKTYGYTKLPELLRDFPYLYDVKSHKGKGTVTIIEFKCLN